MQFTEKFYSGGYRVNRGYGQRSRLCPDFTLTVLSLGTVQYKNLICELCLFINRSLGQCMLTSH